MSKRKREETDGLVDEVDEEDFKLTEAEIAELIDTAPEVRKAFSFNLIYLNQSCIHSICHLNSSMFT
jgi:hypothetical protein